ncbi:MAG: hypothetical protein ACI8TQ_003278, partial [Planctomycetota bacterium]
RSGAGAPSPQAERPAKTVSINPLTSGVRVIEGM